MVNFALSLITLFILSPLIVPGHTAFTLILNLPSSIANVFVTPIIAHLLAAYGDRNGKPSIPAGILGFPLRSPYAASKWAIIGVTKTLAMELGKFNIRVNAVCPGTIKGDRMKRVIRDKAKFTKVSTKTIEKDFVSMSSMKQWILEEDIGKMCSFLISDDSSKVSGQVISVDGHTERND